MTEVELKAALTAELMAALPERLAGLGFVPDEDVRERDLYFNAPHRDFRETDEALRLRTVSGSRQETVITYKGAKTDHRSNTRLEYETALGEGETARAILLALGFSPVLTVSKHRRTFRRGDVTACLDQVEGLGSFLELEHLLQDESGRDSAVDELLALLGRLGVERQSLERRSYLELLLTARMRPGSGQEE